MRTNSGADLIDIRELIERFEELETERQDLTDAHSTAESEEESKTTAEDVQQWDDDNGAEFKAIGDLLDSLKGYGGDHQWRGDWYPVTLIEDVYFETYARDYAEDIHGGAMREAQWPFDCIDWEKAASELQVDYSSVDYDGATYWYR